MNSIVISGVVVSVPQMRYTSNDQKPVTELMLEVAGAKDEDPRTQIKVIAWNGTAESLQQTVQEGDSLLIEGRANINTVENHQGFKESKVEVTVIRFHKTAELPINIFNIVGRVGRDCELKYFESGACIAETSIAVDRLAKNTDPDWWNIKGWSKTAQVMGDYVRKGSQLAITGTLLFEHWTDRTTGTERNKPVIRIDNLKMIGSKRDQESSGYSEPEPRSRRQSPATAKMSKSEVMQEVDAFADIPF